jgi:hypothetical protein
LRTKLAAAFAALLSLSAVAVYSSPASAAPLASIYNKAFWNLNSHKCLDVPNSNPLNNVNIIQWTCNGGANQQWDLIENADKWYSFVNRATGKCLDVRYGSQGNNADIIQFTCNGATNQQWGFGRSGGYYFMAARHSNKCLDVENSRTNDGAVLIQYTCTYANNQLFDLL